MSANDLLILGQSLLLLGLLCAAAGNYLVWKTLQKTKIALDLHISALVRHQSEIDNRLAILERNPRRLMDGVDHTHDLQDVAREWTNGRIFLIKRCRFCRYGERYDETDQQKEAQ